ncbi:redox-sensing transcriptional repressor Rex [Granulicoccus phenolivorans]|uniref:redox-sensing transcriptional repressor Rex n=1 Tax=Granulicoccus phenolivorans TaxID=266854 RepID=UPI000412B0A2|nr:redox-sensing transcriptional repressor Rex [Granulicoccus phenolivorans]
MTTTPGHNPHAIPAASLARLALYRGVLEQLLHREVETVSSNTLAESAGVNPAQLRKDLSMLGSLGTRGVGYEVATLVAELDGHIGSARDWHIVLIGIGNLGRALVGHAGLLTRGFSVAALFDNDPTVIGTEVEGHPVHPMQELAAVVTDPDRCIAVIATPPQAAQTVVEELVAVGLKSVLNFTPVALKVPADVMVRRVDLGAELQILAYHRQLSMAAREGRTPHPG